MTWTVLHDAVEHQRTTEVICRARSNSEEAALVDDHGSTPLHIAVQSNPPAAVLRALIDAHPRALTDKDRHGDTPLHIALKASSSDVDPEAIRTLLRACPAAAGVANREGLMPLHVACRHCSRRDEIIGMLVEEYPRALKTRIRMGDPAPKRPTKPLEDRRPTDHFSPEESDRTTSRSVADLRFRDAGVQVRDGSYPLHMAVSSGASPSVLEALIEGAPEVLAWGNKRGSTPLHVALERRPGETALIDLLLSANPSVARMADKQGKNLPLHVACFYGCGVDAAKGLLGAFPGGIREKNEDDMTPLQVAGVFGKCGNDVLRLLRMSEENE